MRTVVGYIASLGFGLSALIFASGRAEASNPTGPAQVSATSVSLQSTSKTLDHWCGALRSSIKDLKWGIDPCEGLEWQTLGESVEGMPLTYAEFGDKNSLNTTLIFSMIHGDEVTPLYVGLKLGHWLKDWSKDQAAGLASANSGSVRVVLVPLVNPDGFLRKPRTRTNRRGVDVNRNFGTKDWHSHALAAWKKRFRSDPRRYPGPSADSEPETLFQRAMIEKFKPQKVLAIHAPLNFMDYDGPTQLTLKRFPRDYVRECLKLRDQLKAKHFGFFPGSLGNYAGQELGIPTLTLELPSADPRKAEVYWKQFSRGILSMIEYRVPQVDMLSPDPRAAQKSYSAHQGGRTDSGLTPGSSARKSN